MASSPNPDRIAQLQAAIENFTGGDVFDSRREEELAPIRKRALLLLDQRARSRHELRERLLKLEFEPALVDEVLDSLESSSLIDDTLFASEWVRQRSRTRGKSARALDLELREKGVAADIRAEALAQVTPEDEAAQARALAEKKAREVKSVPTDRADYDKALRRVVGVLARRGYGSELTMRVAREALDDRVETLTGE